MVSSKIKTVIYSFRRSASRQLAADRGEDEGGLEAVGLGGLERVADEPDGLQADVAGAVDRGGGRLLEAGVLEAEVRERVVDRPELLGDGGGIALVAAEGVDVFPCLRLRGGIRGDGLLCSLQAHQASRPRSRPDRNIRLGRASC